MDIIVIQDKNGQYHRIAYNAIMDNLYQWLKIFGVNISPENVQDYVTQHLVTV
jgi:hypothetical protein